MMASSRQQQCNDPLCFVPSLELLAKVWTARSYQVVAWLLVSVFAVLGPS